jgi:hypothetical protein
MMAADETPTETITVSIVKAARTLTRVDIVLGMTFRLQPFLNMIQ